MAGHSDVVKRAIDLTMQDSASTQAAQSYLSNPIPPPPHLRSALHQDYEDYHYDFSSPDETDRRLVFNFKTAFYYRRFLINADSNSKIINLKINYCNSLHGFWLKP